MHCDSKRRQKSLELYGWNRLKSQKFIAQGNGYKQHALKGQKLLAQGSALGIVTVSNAPCKGKSFINFRVSFKAFALTGRQVCEHDNPGRCPGRALKKVPNFKCRAYFGTLILVQEAFHHLKVEYFLGQEYSPK